MNEKEEDFLDEEDSFDEDYDKDYEEEDSFDEDYGDIDDELFSDEMPVVEEDIDVLDSDVPEEGFEFLSAESLEDTAANDPYKYLSVELVDRVNNDYTFRIYWQSHGFLTWLSAHILKHPDVIYSAYKNTSIDEPILVVRIEDDKNIRDVMMDCVGKMKKETKAFRKTVEKLKI